MPYSEKHHTVPLLVLFGLTLAFGLLIACTDTSLNDDRTFYERKLNVALGYVEYARVITIEGCRYALFVHDGSSIAPVPDRAQPSTCTP
jgi:glycerol uptake facilitator-like aquaporin